INDMTQVLKAIQKLTLSRANPFADIKSDGAAAISTALTNLGLGEGSALPVGVPVPWPSATPPTGWLKCNGAPFTASEYPKLAQAYPSLKLPDLRGEFIRGWDDGRGIDASRSIMSQQKGSLMSISVSANTNDDRITVIHVYNPPRDYDALISGVGMDSMAGYNKAFDISSLASTLPTPELTSPLGMTIDGQFAVGGVSRPRNVAFNYIVRAA
ncbi:TPA: tail fiber protein, partial [Escherichia coli]|nr:tail fiber protein [Escherichia coli]